MGEEEEASLLFSLLAVLTWWWRRRGREEGSPPPPPPPPPFLEAMERDLVWRAWRRNIVEARPIIHRELKKIDKW